MKKASRVSCLLVCLFVAIVFLDGDTDNNLFLCVSDEENWIQLTHNGFEVCFQDHESKLNEKVLILFPWNNAGALPCACTGYLFFLL